MYYLVSLEMGDHVFAVYSNEEEEELRDGFSFLFLNRVLITMDFFS